MPIRNDIAALEVDQLAEAETCRVDQHQDALVFQVAHSSQNGCYLFFAEHIGQFAIATRPLDELHPVRITEHILVVIANGIHHLVQVAVAHLAFGGHVMLVALNVLRTDVVRMLRGEVPEELLGSVQVGVNGPGAVPGDLQLLLHALQRFRLGKA